MKTIITGSKTVQSYDIVRAAIDSSGFSHLITTVFTSQETGPPIMGYRWAMERKIPVRVFTADWKSHGKPAGIIRDQEMAAFCDAAVLVWDGVEWMTEALRKHFRKLDPPVRYHVVRVEGVAGVNQTLVNQGREESNLLL